MLKRKIRRLERYIPKPVMLVYGIAILSAILHVLFVVSTGFADFFNRYVSSVFRAIGAYLTGWLPFSLAESLIMFIPVIFIILVVISVRVSRKSWRHVIRYVTILFAIAMYFYISFVWMFAAGYQNTTIDKKLDLERRGVSAYELAYTAVCLVEQLNEVADDIDFIYASASVMPYDLKQMNAHLNEAYEKFTDKYSFIQDLKSGVKPILLSEPMTYTHISGVYSFFTGEANLNINYPDYVLAYTAAHELAHQRGIARENEANFIAFLVSMESEDPYIRYSALLNLYEYVSSALYKANPNLYYNIVQMLDMRVRGDMQAYSEFFDKYRETVVSEVSGAINNTYLVMQGTEGTRSYGMVVDLAVAYYMQGE